MAFKKFILPDEKVKVKYILRQKGNITNKNHVAYGGKLEGATDTLVAKMQPNGYFADILEPAEQAYLEKALALAPGDLNPNNLEGYYSRIKIKLGKSATNLDLSKALDYLKYKILLSYTDLVSPDIFSTRKKRTYMYEIVRQKDETMRDTRKVNYKKEAYKLLGKIEDSKEALVGAYRVLKKRKVSVESDIDWLIGQVGNIVEENAKLFVETLKDPDYDMKLFIELAIDQGAIKKNRGLYYTAEGLDLCEDGETPTLINAINFLRTEVNQDIRLLIQSKMKSV
jgi:hypothetical protein